MQPGGVQQTIELEELYEEGTGGRRRQRGGADRRVWHWDESGDAAGEDEMAWLFELRDHRVRSWRPYEDQAEALRAGGFDNEAGAAG